MLFLTQLTKHCDALFPTMSYNKDYKDYNGYSDYNDNKNYNDYGDSDLYLDLD